MREIALPTFEVGQRVRIHNRPVEWWCKCGRELFRDNPLPEYLGILVALNVSHQCPGCGYIERRDEGWHGVDMDDGQRWGVPYTLIEAIKED